MMRRKSGYLVWSLMVGLAFVLSACGGGSSGQSCVIDKDCPTGQLCINSECTPISCTKDEDCPGEKVCRQGACVTPGGPDCTRDEDCPKGKSCVDSKCEVNNDFTLTVINDPVQNGEAEVEVEGLAEGFVPVGIELYLDDELYTTFKMFQPYFTIDTSEMSSGEYELWLKLTDSQDNVLSGSTTFGVSNPSLRVLSAETPDYAYPGGTVELWLEIEGNLDRIEPDFSAIDSAFSQTHVTVAYDSGEQMHKITYPIPAQPTGEEDYYEIPISIHATDGSVLQFDELELYLGSGPLIPFRSADALVEMESLPAEGDLEPSVLIHSLSIEQASVTSGGTLEIDVDLQNETDGAKLLLGIAGWGGHLRMPVSSLTFVESKPDAVGVYRAKLELPVDSIEGTHDFTFKAAVEDRNGQIAVLQARAGPGVTGVDVPQGALQVILSWEPKDKRPDLDLIVEEPSGEIVYWGNKRSAETRASLDLDANSMCPTTGEIVNREVYNAYKPGAGKYKVKVNYYATCDHAGAVNYKVVINGCKMNNQTFNKTSPAAPDPRDPGKEANVGVLVHEFDCDDHYFVKGTVKYRYWRMKGKAKAKGNLARLANVPIKLYDHTNAEIPLDYVPRTNDKGYFQVGFPLEDAKAQQPVEARFYTDDDDVLVVELKHNAGDAAPNCCTGQADKIFEWAHPVKWTPKTKPEMKLPTRAVPLHDSAGFHVFQVMKRAKKYYDVLFKDWNTSYGKVTVETLKDKSPNCGGAWTSCFSPGTNRFYLMGEYTSGRNDGDYYDDGVILHELGHFVMRNAAVDHSPGGGHSWSSRIVPEFAWSEGIATALAQFIVYQHKPGWGKYYCDRNKAGDNCTLYTNFKRQPMKSVPLGTHNGSHTGNLSEAVVFPLLWDLKDKVKDGGKDKVRVHESAFLQYVFDKSAAMLAKTMQAAANWDKGTAGKADLADLIHLWGCPLTAASKPKKADLEKLMKDRYNLDWLNEAGYCPP